MLEPPSGADPFFCVYCWDSEHVRRKIFKNYRERAEAEQVTTALRSYGIDAELIVVGDANPASEI